MAFKIITDSLTNKSVEFPNLYVAAHSSCLDVTDMSFMFELATSFNQPIGGWNTRNVKDMSYMFRGATSFNQDIGGWDTSNVEDMSNVI